MCYLKIYRNIILQTFTVKDSCCQISFFNVAEFLYYVGKLRCNVENGLLFLILRYFRD